MTPLNDGVTLRANSNFGNALATGLMVAAALTGQIVYASPATKAIDLPRGVAEIITDQTKHAAVEILWKLSDAPLSAAERKPG
jgi:hypothetical protein